ncbi:MAG: ABC transporter ATP-binding protein [Chitinophagaceae bacterium]|nr:ABC transporter ATP-binding protein [Chitinophagaceae bacterium]
MEIHLENIGKKYNQNTIFEGVNLILKENQATAILGKNGSGKSSLLKIIAGYVSQSNGEIKFLNNSKTISRDDIFREVAYLSPSLELIEEMTLIEFLVFHFSFKKKLIAIPQMLEQIGLEKFKNDIIENFSSGMKQRVKMAQAFFTDAKILLLDEPCTNLDKEGIVLYNHLIQYFTKDKIIVVASNSIDEYHFCINHFNLTKING